jgi:hypothetical protein
MRGNFRKGFFDSKIPLFCYLSLLFFLYFFLKLSYLSVNLSQNPCLFVLTGRQNSH